MPNIVQLINATSSDLTLTLNRDSYGSIGASRKPAQQGDTGAVGYAWDIDRDIDKWKPGEGNELGIAYSEEKDQKYIVPLPVDDFVRVVVYETRVILSVTGEQIVVIGPKMDE